MAPATGDELLLRIEEVAHTLRLSRATVYRLVQQGVIPTIRIGGSVRVRRAALEAWLAEQTGLSTTAA